jgi:hypothetical protein
MNFMIWLLRILHVGAGVLWAGGALTMAFFIGPTIAATAEAGKQFAAHLMTKLRFHIFMSIVAGTTVLAGAILYWIDSEGFSSSWVNSSAGIGFGIGAGFGLIAFVSGAIFGDALAKLSKIGSQIKGNPTSEQLGQLQALQKRIATAAPIHIVCMIIAILFMAMARYLHLLF